MRRKDGSWLWFMTQAKVVARDGEGRPLRMIGTQTHIAERKRAEQELKAYREKLEELVHQRTAELEVAKATAENANRAKSAFLANMSHELRTPMHAVLAYARLGLAKDPEPKLRDFLGRIVDSGERLLLLLNDLLDLSKLEAGRMQVDFAPHDLEQIVREVAHEIEPLLTGKRLLLEFQHEPGCESCVAPVDRERMAQVFHNILANAVRFSSEGGRIGVRFACTELPCDSPDYVGDTRLALEVAFSDEGVGIPEGELELIFDKFVQSSKTRTKAGGTGLGLAICRQIAELHRGRVWARSNAGRGATFAVAVPLQIRSAFGAGEAA
jgi:signal transduction histidine kinase